ncbi:AMP-dependent synthetase and ligase family protein [Theobroma cacao]|uniref:AMP-dependent synthetase and ligase family protein n=1 Tax=Theobroma cacao TaxID=3641 RepID=A0A061DYG9_THECC|nr:AMP-dependent synthetase and ligase family protein [Theobroma cacao]
MEGLVQCSANYSPLTPVAALGPNTPELCELHFAVPMFPLVVLMLETYPVAKTASSSYHLSGYRSYDSLLIPTNGYGYEIVRPKGECDPISIVFTSGTTGVPKGVVHSHIAAYLTTLAEILLNEMNTMPVYLWTVPMYHCNGWCFIWAIAALGGTNICLRKYDAKFIFDSIIRMSEILGPGTVYPWRPEYSSLPPLERARMKALHGLNHLLMEGVDVKDRVTMESVPFDGLTSGESSSSVRGGCGGRPNEVVGETVCAFVMLKQGRNARSEEIIKFCGERLSENMVPETVVFDGLPHTSTGKTKKAILRERAMALI